MQRLWRGRVVGQENDMVLDLWDEHKNTRNLKIDKGGNSNTLVRTTAMRPDVTAKRYSHGTREFAKVNS